MYEAMKNLNIDPKTLSMRCGPDGSVLSSKGLLTPNYFTVLIIFILYMSFYLYLHFIRV